IHQPFIPSSRNLQAGDLILVSGSLADHGIAVMSQREGLSFKSPIKSDTCALNKLVEDILLAGGSDVHAMRDPTRGGLAATLNEFAENSQVEIQIWEEHIPIMPPVRGACELLGLDPLYIANEGKLVAAVAAKKADPVLQAMRNHPPGMHAAVIGEVKEEHKGRVSLKTAIGGWRIVDMPVGEQLPRIC
ncbi:MAG: AIR synthase-related protein, partial [Calditrichia bacterium]